MSNENTSPFEPIKTEDEDLYGVGPAARLIATTILDSPPEHSYVFSIEGEWGKGKTSLVNRTKPLLRDPKDHRKPVLVEYSPWIVSDSTLLIRELTSTLAQAFDSVNQAQYGFHQWKKYRNIWLRFRLNSGLRHLAVLSSAATPFLDGLGPFPGALVELLTRILRREPSLEEQKRRLAKLITELGADRTHMQVIVIIDDLDRLSPTETLSVIKLVKAVGAFPRVKYLLAFDSEITAAAIKKAGGFDDGNAYLEKIIQRRFAMPAFGAFDLRRVFRQKLQTEFANDADWQSFRAQVVLDLWAGRLLKTPRDVVKILDAIRIRWQNLKGLGADLIDLVWLQLVYEKTASNDASLFDWISDYVTAVEAMVMGGQVSNRQEIAKNLKNALVKCGWKEPVSQGDYKVNDYHHISKIILGLNRSSIESDEPDAESVLDFKEADVEEAVANRRLSSPWHWSLYSRFAQSPNGIDEQEWSELLQVVRERHTPEKIKQRLRDLIDSSNPRADADTRGDQLLSRVISDIQKDSSNAPIWFDAIMSSADELFLRSKSTGFGFSRSIEFSLKKLSENAMGAISKTNDRKRLLRKVFQESSSLWALSELYRDEAFRRDPESKSRRKPYLLELEFKTVERELKKRIKKIDPSEISKSPSAWDAFYAAKNILGDDKCKNWFAGITKDDAEFVEVLVALQTIRSSEQVIEGVPSSYLNKFADVNDVQNRLKKIAKRDDPLAKSAQSVLDRWYDDLSGD